jgi:5-formyltetrahydrofolate cyclo-ligase
VNKTTLRKLYLEKRNMLTVQDCNVRSKRIADNFFNHFESNLSQSLYLHLYLPIEGKKEIDTILIFSELRKSFPNVKVALSKSNFTDYSMQFFEYSMETKLIENSYGIPEPEGGKIIKPKQLDFVLIPLLVTDESGNRIGYGKGFYDRFLANCEPDCKKIGLSFEEPVSEIIPDEFDVPLDFCITPEKVYEFGKFQR